jgi:hypothetical protein
MIKVRNRLLCVSDLLNGARLSLLWHGKVCSWLLDGEFKVDLACLGEEVAAGGISRLLLLFVSGAKSMDTLGDPEPIEIPSEV